jgi:molybdopterin molybdotransferase
MQDSDLPEEITIYTSVIAGDFVRLKGQDVKKGRTIFKPGRRLLVHDVAMLAALGEKEPQVYRKPRIAILSTGDELVDLQDPLTPGKIRDSNSYALQAAILRTGGEPILLGISPDDPEVLRSKLRKGLEKSVDLLLTTAGVSMGAYDYVREVIVEQGEVSFWKVNLRPGKPLLVGTFRRKPVIGLPGNPVSVAVTFELFVRPALEKMLGLKGDSVHRVKVSMEHEVVSDGRESFLRAKIRWEADGYRATLTGSQDSGVLSSMVHANALVRVPAGLKRIESGRMVDAWILDGAIVPLMDEVKKRYE